MRCEESHAWFMTSAPNRRARSSRSSLLKERKSGEEVRNREEIQLHIETSNSQGRAGTARGPARSPIKLTASSEANAAELPVSHLLRHIKNELTVAFFHFAQQAAKLVEKACIFSDAAPGNVIRRLPLGEIRQLRRFLTVIKELIEWAFESARKFFQRFNRRYCMAIFNAGNITTQQTCALFDVALGEFLFFAECAKTVTYNHGGIIPCRYGSSKHKLDFANLKRLMQPLRPGYPARGFHATLDVTGMTCHASLK